VAPPEQAQGKVKQGCALSGRLGLGPAPCQVFSPSPELVGLRAQTIGYYLAHPKPSRGLLALIRMPVAEELAYYYCIFLNREILKAVGGMDGDAAAQGAGMVSGGILCKAFKMDGGQACLAGRRGS